MSHFQGIEVAAEVVRAAQAGEPRAHEAIYRACRRPIYTLIRRLVVRAAIADELFQETFVEVLRNIGAYSGQGAFGGWVRSIAVSKCLMYLRSPWHRSLLYLDNDDEADGAGGAVGWGLAPGCAGIGECRCGACFGDAACAHAQRGVAARC